MTTQTNESTTVVDPPAGLRRVRSWPWILGLLGLAILAYVLDPGAPGFLGGALRADFAFDDLHLIVENTRLDRPGGALDGFRGDYYTSSVTATSGEARALGYYRPLAVLSNWVDTRIWGGEAVGFHLTNLALHAGVVIGFFLLVRRLLGRTETAALAAGLFAVHPVHTESVTFISGRVDVLAALFGVWALWAHVRARQSEGTAEGSRVLRSPWRVLALVCFFLALLSKEMAITFPAAVFLIELFCEPKRDWKTAARAVVPWILVVILYLGLRYLTIGSLTSRAESDLGFTARWARIAFVVATYLRLLVLPPFGFNVEPAPNVPAGPTPIVLLATLVPLAVAALAWWPRLRLRVPGASLGILWMLAALVPVSHLVPVETLIGERYLYIPSLGAMLAIAALLIAWLAPRPEDSRQGAAGARRWPLWTLAALIGVAGVATTAHRNTFWRDNLTFWRAKTELTPNSSEPWSALGIEYLKVNEDAQAEVALQRALSVDPRHLEALNNYALLLLNHGQPAEALKVGARAITVDPEYAEALNTIGTAFHAMGRFPEAVGQYKRALRSRPDYRLAWINLGNTYLTAGVPDSALRAFRRAVSLGPDRALDLQIADCHALAGRPAEGLEYLIERGVVPAGSPEASLMEGSLYATAGHLEIARDAFLRSTAANPGNVAAWVELGQTLAALGRPDDARAAFERAIEVDPASSISHNNLGVLAEESGDPERALDHYQRALSIAPEDPAVARNVGSTLVELGRYDDARPFLDRGVSAGDPLAFYYRGLLNERTGDTGAASDDYRAAVQLRPTFAEAQRALGLLCLQLGDRQAAARSFEMFLTWASPTDPARADIEAIAATLPAPTGP
jgi:tetratricopeptide (TPR) repeat protein